MLICMNLECDMVIIKYRLIEVMKSDKKFPCQNSILSVVLKFI